MRAAEGGVTLWDSLGPLTVGGGLEGLPPAGIDGRPQGRGGLGDRQGGHHHLGQTRFGRAGATAF